ncbi:hypothetical protein AMECASPLE_013418 [Ameca splendens]|uniref:Uncharacterized protein n=1 Tax=Ameca splendens TaxID=208324 RepID=A0ABV0YDA2_9TELE
MLVVVFVFRFIRDQVAGAADSAETPRCPSPQTPPPAPLGGAKGVPIPAERHSPSSVFWAIPLASSWWDVPGTPPEEGVQEASDIDACEGPSSKGIAVFIVFILPNKLQK